MDQRNDVPADAVRVTLPPAQNVVAPLAVMVAVAAALTVTVCEEVAEQPLASVTVTEYEVVAAGETVIDCVVAPVDQLNDTPPLAVSVALPPAQMEDGPLIAAVGGGLTVTTVGADVALQPPLLTVTV